MRFKLIILLFLLTNANNIFAKLSHDEITAARIENETIIKKMRELYGPVFKRNSLKLVIENNWNDEVVEDVEELANLWLSPGAADIIDNKIVDLDFRRGLTALKNMSLDAATLIVCHEAGHVLGGAPLNPPSSFGVITSREGQADYFSTLKCTRTLWSQDEIQKLERPSTVPEEKWKLCLTQFQIEREQYYCQRSLVAISELIQTRYFEKVSPAVSLFNSSQVVVSQTLDKYPDSQCRIDTLVAGTLCNKVGELSKRDLTQGLCATENGDTIGTRPTCWYKPLQSSDIDELKKISNRERKRSTIHD